MAKAAKKDDTGDEKISKSFTRREFWCPCCHSVGKNVEGSKAVLALADKIRKELGKPLTCTSGYRCKKHNAKVGGVENSWHTQGMAMDIHSPGVSVEDLAAVAEACGAAGIGRYYGRKFVHIDVGPPGRRWRTNH